MSDYARIFSVDPAAMIVYGLLTGLVFGFILQKAGVTRYQVILGQFLFKDFTVLKVMLTAIITGAIGIYGMRAMGMEFPLHVKGAALAGTAIGGLIFGIGMAILGYCPGTGAAAIGDGSRHAIPGLLGMFFGAVVYAEVYPMISGTLLKMADVTVEVNGKLTDKITFADLSGLSPWLFIAVLGAIWAVLAATLRQRPAV